MELVIFRIDTKTFFPEGRILVNEEHSITLRFFCILSEALYYLFDFSRIRIIFVDFARIIEIESFTQL